MKPVFCLMIFIVNVITGYCQDCNSLARLKPSVLVRGQDHYNTAISDNKKPAGWDLSKMKLQLGMAESWIKKTLTGFTGAQLHYSNDYFLDHVNGGNNSTMFYKATGLKAFYYGKMRFFQYYCHDNNNKILTEGESGSFVNVIFNNVFASDLCSEVGVFYINGKLTFKIFEKVRSEGRIDFYERRAKSNIYDTIYTSKHDFIIIRNSDKPVFIPVTRKEYLDQLLKDLEKYETDQKDFLITNYQRQIKSFEEEIRVYKEKDKSYTPEKEAKRRKFFAEDVNEGKLNKAVKKIEDDIAASAKIIKQYLNKPDEWLSRSFGSFYTYSTFTANGLTQYFDKLDIYNESADDLSRTAVVSINPFYYNSSLGNDHPQLIMVHVQKKTYPHMLKVVDLLNRPNAFKELEAILNPGKSSVAAVTPGVR